MPYSSLFRLPPLITNIWFVLLVFLLALVIFHVLFLNRTEIWWNKVDYVWLGITALGLIGAASQARQVVAADLLGLLSALDTSGHDEFRFAVDAYNNSAEICRNLQMSKLSPPPDGFDRIQREYDAVCDWVRETSKRRATDRRFTMTITGDMLPPVPEVSDSRLIKVMKGFRNAIAEHNAVWEARLRLAEAKRPSTGEMGLAVLSPMLIAVALALRITKVTADLRSKSLPSRAEAGAPSRLAEEEVSESRPDGPDPGGVSKAEDARL